MLKTKIIEDSYQALWFEQVLDHLKKKTLTDDDVSRIIVDVIGEYVAGQIDLAQLLTATTALKNCRAKLSPDIKYTILDLSALHEHKSDEQFINNILIDVLRKVSNT